MKATADLLRDLLVSHPDYRRRWRRHVQRERGTGLSQSAVANVLALHLVNTGEREDGQEAELARNEVRHKVRRALAGETLAGETLDWFIGAFRMEQADRERLWDTFVGSEPPDSGIAHTIDQSREMAKRQWHRTVALFERYFVDAEGHIRERRTLHTVKALEDGVDSYLFNHEPHVSRIEVLHGGRLGAHYEYGGGLYSDEIVFTRPLRRGQNISLEYHSFYRDAEKPIMEVRRPARARSENIDIALHFTRDHLPKTIYWAIWSDHFEGAPVSETPVALDENHSVQRFVPFIEQTVVGFRWTW